MSHIDFGKVIALDVAAISLLPIAEEERDFEEPDGLYCRGSLQIITSGRLRLSRNYNYNTKCLSTKIRSLPNDDNQKTEICLEVVHKIYLIFRTYIHGTSYITHPHIK